MKRTAMMEFAEKWLAKFRDPGIDYVELVDHPFYDEGKALGFMMEFSTEYMQTYGRCKDPCGEIEAISQVTDPILIGSALVTQWRYYNHWAYDAEEILEPSVRRWFIGWLMRLREIEERKTEKGEAKQMEYSQFQQIMDTMEQAGYDYKKDWKGTEPKVGYSFRDHISALVYAQLSNQRPWKPIADHFPEINGIFHNFDITYLKNADPAELESKLRAIRCGNRQIHRQMLALKENIETLERICRENEDLDLYYHSTEKFELVQSLCYGKYKLKQMGVALISEYLKNIGVDIIKPDVHVLRILGRLGLTEHSPATVKEAFDVCHRIAVAYGMREAEVDSVLWQYGADNYFEECRSTPDCRRCLVKGCKARCSDALIEQERKG